MDAQTFKPAWWLRNPHLQTLWPTVCRRDIKDLPLTLERFELADGDFIDLNWLGSGNGPIVLLLHGFEGSINSHYAKGMLKTLQDQGWRGLFMHFRGCSGEPNRLSRTYHSGDTQDVNCVMQALRKREPNTKMAAIGVSLGGNVLLKWLGESKENNPLSAAIAISVPFELAKAVRRINHGFSRFYQWYLLKCVFKRLTHKFQLQPPSIPIPAFSELSTLKEFDDKVTAPLNGFSGADEYYKTSSSRQYLKGICVPTLLLQAKDDPFMTADVIPNDHEVSEQVKIEVLQTGGHVGFVAGKYPWRPEYWLEQRVPTFLRQHF